MKFRRQKWLILDQLKKRPDKHLLLLWKIVSLSKVFSLNFWKMTGWNKDRKPLFVGIISKEPSTHCYRRHTAQESRWKYVEWRIIFPFTLIGNLTFQCGGNLSKTCNLTRYFIESKKHVKILNIVVTTISSSKFLSFIVWCLFYCELFQCKVQKAVTTEGFTDV